MRRRSSSRCSRKLMPVISSEARFWAVSRTGLGIGARRFGGRWLNYRCSMAPGVNFGDIRRGTPAHHSLGLHDRSLPSLLWWEDLRLILRPWRRLFGLFFQFNVQHLRFQLVLEFVAGALELGHEFAHLAGQSG